MEKFKVEGVTFYYESQKHYASKCDIKDIDIEKGVDTVVFTAPPSIRYVDIKLQSMHFIIVITISYVIKSLLIMMGISAYHH